MEPTDPPPPTPQRWGESSAWAPANEPETGAPPPSVLPAQPAVAGPAPAAVSGEPSAGEPLRPRREMPAVRWLVLSAVIAELVIIALGDNQWVTNKVTHYTGSTPQPGFLHQFVYSTQSLAWRVTSTGGEGASQWVSSLVRVAVVLVLSALIIALIARRGSFWRAAVASLVAVVFSTQVAGIVGQIIWNGPHFIGFTGYYTSSDDEQSLEITLRGSTGGGRATTAIFGGATGYRFVGAVTLGVLVGIVVGIVARRLGEGEPQERSDGASPPQAFFPPGAMQRGYEAGVAGPPNPEGGRHSRD